MRETRSLMHTHVLLYPYLPIIPKIDINIIDINPPIDINILPSIVVHHYRLVCRSRGTPENGFPLPLQYRKGTRFKTLEGHAPEEHPLGAGNLLLSRSTLLGSIPSSVLVCGHTGQLPKSELELGISIIAPDFALSLACPWSIRIYQRWIL